MMAYHDTAWANSPLDTMVDDFQEVKAADGMGLYSQLGYVLCIAPKESHACPRVCRSTFAAEVMAGKEGWEDGLAFRAML